MNHAARRLTINASEAPKILAGNWFDLWQVKTGKAEEEDLSDVIPVQMGIILEPYILKLAEKEHGKKLINKGADQKGYAATIDGIPYACTPDSLTEDGALQIEAKFRNPWYSHEECVGAAYAQIQHSMLVTGREQWGLATLTGGFNFYLDIIQRDDAFIAEYQKQAKDFWWHVTENVAPDDLKSKPQNFEYTIPKLDLESLKSNRLPELIPAWIERKAQAAEFKDLDKELKDLIPAEAKAGHGYGITFSRAKNGATTIKIKE